MNKWINGAKLFFASSLILTTISCGFAPQSECELTEADGRTILGINVKAIDKSDPVWGESAARNDKNWRACGYVSKEPTEHNYLYWVQGTSADEEEAKSMYERTANTSSDKKNYLVEKLARLGDEARLIRYETENSKELLIAVRKGKSIMLITVSKPSASEIPVEQVKSLAERLAAKN